MDEGMAIENAEEHIGDKTFECPNDLTCDSNIAAVKLKTPSDFLPRLQQDCEPKPSYTSSVWYSSSALSLDESEKGSNSTDQFFIVPGVHGQLTKEEFTKIPSPIPRHDEALETQRTDQVSEGCSYTSLVREKEWRALQEMRIRGLEEAVREREKLLQQERRKTQRAAQDYQQTTTDVEANNARLQRELQSAHEEIEKQKKENEMLKTSHQTTDKEIKQLQEAYAEQKQENILLRTISAKMKDKLVKMNQSETKKYMDRDKCIDDLQTKITESDKLIDSLKTSIKNEQMSAQLITQKHDDLLEANKQLAEELQEEKNKNKELIEDTEISKNRAVEWKSGVIAEQAKRDEKISFLVQGIRSLESEWKQRYEKLKQEFAIRQKRLSDMHKTTEKELSVQIGVMEEKLKNCEQQLLQHRHRLVEKENEVGQLTEELSQQRNHDSQEHRETAEQMSARDLALSELRAQVSRLQLQLSEERQSQLQQPTAIAASETSKWQAACSRLKDMANRLQDENERLRQQQSQDSSSEQQLEELDGVSAENKQLRCCIEELEQQVKRGRSEVASMADTASAERWRTMQVQQLLIGNSKLNETIELQCETIRSLQQDLQRHRVSANSSQFLEQQNKKLNCLLEAPPLVHTTADDTAEVRALKYKLQLAAQYIGALGRERSEMLRKQDEMKQQLSASRRAGLSTDKLDGINNHLRPWLLAANATGDSCGGFNCANSGGLSEFVLEQRGNNGRLVCPSNPEEICQNPKILTRNTTQKAKSGKPKKLVSRSISRFSKTEQGDCAAPPNQEVDQETNPGLTSNQDTLENRRNSDNPG